MTANQKIKVPARIIYNMKLDITKLDERIKRDVDKRSVLIKSLGEMEAIKDE